MVILGIRFSSARVVIWVAALLAAGALGLANMASALDIGPETPVGSQLGTELGNQESPAVAAWTGGYLAVFKDRRNGTDYDISGIFLDANGNPIGDAFLISTTSAGPGPDGDQESPSVAFNGTNFLVAWTDKRYPYSGTPKIYCARVTTSGTVLDPDGILIYSNTTNAQFAPAVASNGVDWEVVWQKFSGITMDIYGVKVSSAGIVSSNVPIAQSSSDEMYPSIVWNGTYYVVVYQKSNADTFEDIHASLLNSSGNVTVADVLVSSTAGSAVPGQQLSPKIAVASNGVSFVVWQDLRNADTGSDIYGARLTASGTLYDTESIPLYVAAGEQETPCISWDGTYFEVAWRDSVTLPAKLYGLRVDMYGGVYDSPPLQLSTSAPYRSSGSAIAGRNGLSSVLWAVSTGSLLDIYGCTLSSSGTTTTEKVISIGSQDQPTYAAAFDGTNYVVVWTDKRGARSAIYASRVSPYGEVLDPNGVLLSSSTRDQREPAIRWNGSVYLVAWTEGTTSDSDIMGVKLLPDLTILSSPAISIAVADNAQYNPSIAWSGTYFMVVYVDTKQATQTFQHDIMGALVDPVANVVRSVPYCADGLCSAGICTDLNDQWSPSVAWSGTNWLVTWQDMRNTTADVYYSRLDANGYTIGTAGGTKVSTFVSAKMTPEVAFDGTNYFIVWADGRSNSAGCYDIYGVRMNTSGTRLDASDIAICSQTTTDQSAPALVWAGDRYFVSWQDARSYTNGYNYDIYTARVSSSGALQDAGGVFVSSGGNAETSPCLVTSGTDWAGILYSKNLYPIHKLQFRSAGDQVALAVASVSATRGLPNGRKISLASQIVSAGSTQLTSMFYIEDPDRTAGIRVASSTSCGEAALVDVSGTLATVNGERQISSPTVTVSPSTGTVPGPLGLTLGSLGGSAISFRIPGVQDGLGLNNIGLLVTVAGKVVSTGTGNFIIQDGSSTPGGSALQVKVTCPAGVTLPVVGKTVSVTGISSCELSGSAYVRIILARKNADIKTYN